MNSPTIAHPTNIKLSKVVMYSHITSNFVYKNKTHLNLNKATAPFPV